MCRYINRRPEIAFSPPPQPRPLDETWKVTVDAAGFTGIASVGSKETCEALVRDLLGREMTVEMPSGERRVVGIITRVDSANLS